MSVATADRYFSAIIERGETCYVATSPETGVTSQGGDPSEALSNLQEAVSLFLEESHNSEAGFSGPVFVTLFQAHATTSGR